MSRYRITDENGIYFTTHTIVEWAPVFKEEKYFKIITDSLRFCMKNKGLHVFGYVIMLNHFHLMAQTKDGVKFQDVMRDMKKFTSLAISRELKKDNEKLLLHIFKNAAKHERGARNFKIWQNEYHPQIIYSAKVCRQKLEYMHNNPLRKGFVKNQECWFYSSARNYLLGKNDALPIELLELL